MQQRTNGKMLACSLEKDPIPVFKDAEKERWTVLLMVLLF